MTDSDLKKLTLASAARLIRNKEIKPVELVEAVLDRVQRLNDRMRAFITITGEQALESARSAEKNSASGPLHGVPVSLKDLYDTKGVRTTAGGKVFADRIPTEDATVVRKLNDAGAVIVGKANMHEFAFGVTTINPHFGTARNPWKPDYISGGSSGGSASAVALALGFGSLGSDTGGSIRIPASVCGIVGLKPTYGRCSLQGVVPLSWSLDHPGPMAQTVEDVAILLSVIAGHDPLDPYSRNRPVPSYVDALTGNIKGLRIGIPKSYFFEELDVEVDAAMKAALKVFERLGASLVEVDLQTATMQRGIWSQIASPEAFSFHEVYLQTRGQDYGADVRGRFEVGRLLLSVDYVRAQRARTVMKNECRDALKRADVIITPTLPVPPPRIDQSTVQRGSGQEPVGVALTRFTRHFNITGSPCVSIPCGFTKEGMPIGMQIVGAPFDEATVLRAAHAYEQDAKWFQRRPTV